MAVDAAVADLERRPLDGQALVGRHRDGRGARHRRKSGPDVGGELGHLPWRDDPVPDGHVRLGRVGALAEAVLDDLAQLRHRERRSQLVQRRDVGRHTADTADAVALRAGELVVVARPRGRDIAHVRRRRRGPGATRADDGRRTCGGVRAAAEPGRDRDPDDHEHDRDPGEDERAGHALGWAAARHGATVGTGPAARIRENYGSGGPRTRARPTRCPGRRARPSRSCADRPCTTPPAAGGGR